ncbi:hypothetical protein GCM10009660_39780 [Catellatospora bangladeshensis]
MPGAPPLITAAAVAPAIASVTSVRLVDFTVGFLLGRVEQEDGAKPVWLHTLRPAIPQACG